MSINPLTLSKGTSSGSVGQLGFQLPGQREPILRSSLVATAAVGHGAVWQASGSHHLPLFSHHQSHISRSAITVCSTAQHGTESWQASVACYVSSRMWQVLREDCLARQAMRTMPPYVIHRSRRCRRSMTRSSESDSPTLLRTSSTFRCAACGEHGEVCMENYCFDRCNQSDILPDMTDNLQGRRRRIRLADITRNYASTMSAPAL